MRFPRSLVLVATWLVLTSCSTVSPERARRNQLLWRAAQACQRGTVELQYIDSAGVLHYRYRDSVVESVRPFEACLDEKFAALMRGETLAELQRRERAEAELAPPPGRSGLRPGGSARTAVPIRVAGTAVVVPVRINGQATAALLDLEATRSIVSQDLVSRLGIAVRQDALQVVLSDGAGRTVTAPLLNLHAVSVGELAVENLSVAVDDRSTGIKGVDMILGADFLAFFDARLDREAAELVLEVPR